jgi:hypothetical protein
MRGSGDEAAIFRDGLHRGQLPRIHLGQRAGALWQSSHDGYGHDVLSLQDPFTAMQSATKSGVVKRIRRIAASTYL